MKFYEKHSKRCNSCQSRYVVAKTKKASIENNRRKIGDTTGKRKQYDSDEESASSGEEKEEEEEEEEEEEQEEEEEEAEGGEYEVEGESTKKKIAQKMRSSVKLLRTSKSFFYSTFKKTIDCHGDFANK